MNNFIVLKDKIAFHPGYYIDEIIKDNDITQEEYASKLEISVEDLELIIRAEKSITVDIATKLSQMIGTSVEYWMNLQNKYDTLVAEYMSDNK